MKHFLERGADRAVIRIGRHEVAHVRPPPLAHVCRRDSIPLCFTLELYVAKQVMGVPIQEDRIGANAVIEQRALEILPNRLMPADVLRFLIGINRHSEGFAHRRTDRLHREVK